MHTTHLYQASIINKTNYTYKNNSLKRTYVNEQQYFRKIHILSYNSTILEVIYK